METPELILIPPSPLSDSQSRLTPVSTSTSAHTHSSGSYRSSSEDTAVTIFSMYSDSRERWASRTKVLAVEPMARSRRHSVETANSTVSSTWRGTPDRQGRPRSEGGRKVSKPPSSFQNGHAASAEVIGHRHSIAGSAYRTSDESISLPYTRHSPPATDEPPPLPPKPHAPLTQTPPKPSKPLPPLVDPSGSTSTPPVVSPPSEGEDPDAYHVRSTYAQLDVSGVRGDGYEEGVELTRAKQGGTTYLTAQPHDCGRGPSSDVSPKELEVLANVDRCVHKPRSPPAAH